MKDLYINQNITNTLIENYMPYAMSVIVSRAIPEIDGFKPSHRKLLYTMYQNGLLNSERKKSAKIVGNTMSLNPHGDAPIYETMVRLSKGYEALLHPLVDSKGNFGKIYSKNMVYAASRYTEAKLSPICAEIFGDIDKDTVDFVDNYDNTMKEPTLLPASFPNILVNANKGIAVGMMSSICSFNLIEICDTTIELMRNPDHIISSTLKAPDFPTGGQIIYPASEIDKIYSTGVGAVRIRAKYKIDKKNNYIDITEIPYTTTVEAIAEKIIELVKLGKIKEINDVRDEIGKDGFKFTIELKRGQNPEKLMKKLFKMTTLEDTFSCNFNVLIAGVPKVLSVKEILEEWIAFRKECIRRRTYFDKSKKVKKLHLLHGLENILLDIDKAISIIRNTEEESDVIPNLMIGFGIDNLQAEYVAEIKLRNLNKEYILKRTDEINILEDEIAELTEILNNNKKVEKIIISDLERVKKKYGQKRKSEIIYEDTIPDENKEEDTPDYPVNIFITKDGYFKKITPQSLRISSNHKLKDNDYIVNTFETSNKAELLFFTNKANVYKSRVSDFADSKASVLGDFIPGTLDFEDDEKIIYSLCIKNYNGYMLFLFENGKGVKIPLSSYETKTRRRKLVNAFSVKSPLVCAMYIENDFDIVLYSSNGKTLLVNTALISVKTTKDSAGVNIMTQKGKNHLFKAVKFTENLLKSPSHYMTKNIPAIGKFLREEDKNENEQISLL